MTNNSQVTVNREVCDIYPFSIPKFSVLVDFIGSISLFELFVAVDETHLRLGLTADLLIMHMDGL
jgi:hypothetical protein